VSELARGWERTTLREVCRIVSGSTPRSTEPKFWGGEIPWITPDDLSRHASKMIARGRRSLTPEGYASCSAQMVPAGTVLYTSRAPIGYAAIASQPVCTNQGFKSLVPPEGVVPDFLYWYMRHATEEVRSRASGTTFAEISGRRMAEVPLLLAPTAEQERIVAAIEEQVSRLDAGVSALDRVRQRLKGMRAAVLQGAFADWFVHSGARSDDIVRSTKRVRDLAWVTSGATPARGARKYWDGGSIPWVTSTLVNQDQITAAREFVTDLALKETSIKLMPVGTLLVAMYGEGQTRGRCSELSIEATTNQACAAIVLNPDSGCLPEYLKLFFAASYEANRRLSAGGVQPNLSVGIIKELDVPLPSIDVQQVVVSETARQLDAIDQLTQQLSGVSRRGQRLRSAILAAAFSGKLAAQDPNDEPASILLAQIAARHDPSSGHQPARTHRPRTTRRTVPT
jgi:type I restriction enzyme S subunit